MLEVKVTIDATALVDALNAHTAALLGREISSPSLSTTAAAAPAMSVPPVVNPAARSGTDSSRCSRPRACDSCSQRASRPAAAVHYRSNYGGGNDPFGRWQNRAIARFTALVRCSICHRFEARTVWRFCNGYA